MWCNFFLDAKRIPPNWDELMKLSCVPSVLITQEIWTRYVARCPVEVAPEDESYRDQDADNDNGGADEGVENSGTDEGDWQRQAKCLVSCTSNAGSVWTRRIHEKAGSRPP